MLTKAGRHTVRGTLLCGYGKSGLIIAEFSGWGEFIKGLHQLIGCADDLAIVEDRRKTLIKPIFYMDERPGFLLKRKKGS